MEKFNIETILRQFFKLSFALDILNTSAIISSVSILGVTHDYHYSQYLKEGLMRIKFDRIENFTTKPNAKGKVFKMIAVFGEALEGKLQGQEWNTKFFSNNKDLYSQVKQANKGDIVTVKMEKFGSYFNPTEFTVESASEAETNNRVEEVVSRAAGTVMQKPVFEDETVKNYKNRKLNIVTALNSVGTKMPKTPVSKYMEQAGQVADSIEDYCNQTGMFSSDYVGTTDDIPVVDVQKETPKKAKKVKKVEPKETDDAIESDMVVDEVDI